MSFFPRPVSPRALIADLRAFVAERGSFHWVAAFFAILMPVVIVIGFIVDGRTNILPGEQIVYVESWRADRSDAEIKAAIAKNQAAKEAAQAEKQRQFQELEKRFGME